jgi:hypothetical protein
MDTNKFDFFVAKYRSAEPEELQELHSRADSLAEEAQAALRQVASERSLSLTQQQPTASLSPSSERRAARDAEERAYSPVRAELIHLRKVWFLWSIPLSLLAGIFYGFAAPSAKGTLMSLPVGLVGLFAIVWPLYCLYKLSHAVDPKRSVAWAMVATQFVPIVGWLSAISLVLKAGRIRRAVLRSKHAASDA